MRIEIPDSKALAHEMSFPVRWGEMDAIGHVNNVAYFSYLEMVRVDWLGRMGYLRAEGGQGVVVANAFCNFMRQLTYPCDLVAKLYLGHVGGSSFDHYVTFERADEPGQVCSAGGGTIVWVDFARQKAAPMPDGLRGALLALRAGLDAA